MTTGYELIIETRPNHDFPVGHPNREPNIPPYHHKALNSIEQVQAAYEVFRVAQDFGSGNLKRADVYRDGRHIGRLSFNGRYWPKARGE